MRRTSFAALLFLALAPTACRESKPEAKPCCEQPKIPAGVPAFKIVADDVTGPGDGQVVKIKAVLSQPVERQDMYPVLHTIYAWAMTRTAFEPIDFRAEIYPNEAATTSGQPAAVVERPRGQQGPTCDNAIPWTFRQAVTRAFEASLNRLPPDNLQDTCHVEKPKTEARFDETFKHKPALTIDESSRSAAVEYPFLADGKDEYASKLSFNQAMTYWIEFTTSMFRRAPDLKTFKFSGILNDAPVVTISLSRQDFESKFASLQEEVASHAAVTFQKLGMNATSDKAAEKEQETFKAKTFRDALKLLPPNQVSVAASLK